MYKIEMVSVVFITQFAFIFFKYLNIRIIAKAHVFKSVFMTFLIQSTWLISTAIGVKAIWDAEVVIIIAYLLSGMLGSYFSFKVSV